MSFNDQATEIRQGEELDPVRVDAFLQAAVPGLEGPLSVRQFPGGFSNLTYLITF